jgi:hypothetical protein
VIWKSFNKAFLAKQCWRVLQNQETILSAKNLKAKYFPHGMILDAKLPNWVGDHLMYGAVGQREISSRRGLCGELGMVNKQKYGRIMTASNSSTSSPNSEERAQ